MIVHNFACQVLHHLMDMRPLSHASIPKRIPVVQHRGAVESGFLRSGRYSLLQRRGDSVTRKDGVRQPSEKKVSKAGMWPQTALPGRIRMKSKHIAGVTTGLQQTIPSLSERKLTQQTGLHGLHSRNTGTFPPEARRPAFLSGTGQELGSMVRQAPFRLNDSLRGFWDCKPAVRERDGKPVLITLGEPMENRK